MISLLWYALDGVFTELRVLLAKRHELLELRTVPPRLNFFHTVPNVYGNALWLFANKSYRVAQGYEPAARCFNEGRHLWPIFLGESIRVRGVDLRNKINWRLGLSVKTLL